MNREQPAKSPATAQNVPDVLDAGALQFLASLQQKVAEVQARAVELNARDAAVSEAQARLEAERQRLDDVRAQLEEARAQSEETRAELEQRMRTLSERERAVEQENSKIEERREAAERDALQAVAVEREAVARAQSEAASLRQQAQQERDAARSEVEGVAADRRVVEQRLSEIEARERSATAREAEARERSEQAQAREDEADQRERSVAREAAECADRLEEVRKTESQIQARQRAVMVATEEVERLAQQQQAAAAELEKKRTAFEARLAELVKNEKSLQTSQGSLAAAQHAAAQQKAENDRREAAVAAREQQLRAAHDELERRRGTVAQSEAQAVQLEATARHLREQAEQIKSAAERQVQQWQDKSAEAQFQADSALQQVKKLQEQLSVSQNRARALEEEIDQVKVLGMSVSPEGQARIDGLSRRAEAAEQRAATLQEIIDQHSDEVAKAEARFDAVCRQLEEAQKAASSVSNEHAARIAEINSRLESANADAAATRAAKAQAQQAMDEADQLRVAAAAQLKSAQEAIEKAAHLEGECKARACEIAELKSQLAAHGPGASVDDAFAADQRRRLEAELAQREEALAVLGQRLLNAEERNLAMQVQLERITDELADAEERGFKAGKQSTPHSDHAHAMPEVAVSQTRRQRLRKVRDLLAQEHRKVLLAKEALGRHKAEADAVLQQRARLSQAAQNLQAAEIEVNKSKAKSAAGTVVIAAMTTLITVTGLAYFAASTLWPSTYAARATLSAESDGRSPTDQQKKSWLAAHERLAADPQVYTLAAEQFGQRGMRNLSNPAAVQDRFGRSLALLTDVPGQMTFELRGEGREQTARELETFVGAVSAIANSRREARSDGLSTSVAKPAEAGREPLDSKVRQALLGSIAGGMLAALAMGYAVFKLLSRVRKNTSNGDVLDAFLPADGPAGRIGDRSRQAA